MVTIAFILIIILACCLYGAMVWPFIELHKEIIEKYEKKHTENEKTT